MNKIRLQALSDGVIAILMLALKLPHGTGGDAL